MRGYHVDREEMAFCVLVFSEEGESFEGFCSRNEAEAFADEVAREEGSDCFVMNLLRVAHGAPEAMPARPAVEEYGLYPGADFPSTLFPPPAYQSAPDRREGRDGPDDSRGTGGSHAA